MKHQYSRRWGTEGVEAAGGMDGTGGRLMGANGGNNDDLHPSWEVVGRFQPQAEGFLKEVIRVVLCDEAVSLLSPAQPERAFSEIPG